jgi:hypothetical protein
VPADKTIDLFWDWSIENSGLFELYEAPTGAVPGTGITPIQRNRASTNTSAITVNDVSSITSDGVLLYLDQAAGKAAQGSERRSSNMFRLNVSTLYIAKITSYIGGNDVSWGFTWVEN